MTPAQYLRLDRDQAKHPSLAQAAQAIIDRAWTNGYASATDSALSRLAFLASIDSKSITKQQLLTELQSTIKHIEADFTKRIK